MKKEFEVNYRSSVKAGIQKQREKQSDERNGIKHRKYTSTATKNGIDAVNYSLVSDELNKFSAAEKLTISYFVNKISGGDKEKQKDALDLILKDLAGDESGNKLQLMTNEYQNYVKSTDKTGGRKNI